MKSNIRLVLAFVIAVSAFISSACTACETGGLKGTYSDANGAVLLELKSGGKANFTWMGDVADCTYSSSGRQLRLSCKGDAGNIGFTIHDDGSLTGPAGSFMPMLRKHK